MWYVPHLVNFRILVSVGLFGLLGREVNQNGRDRGGRQSGYAPNLAEVSRACPFKPFDHLIREPTDPAKLEGFGYFQRIVMIYAFRRDLLLQNVAAVHRIREGSIKLRVANVVSQFRRQ